MINAAGQTECLFFFDHPLAFRSYVNSEEFCEQSQEFSISAISTFFEANEELVRRLSIPVSRISINKFSQGIISACSYSYWRTVADSSLSINRRLEVTLTDKGFAKLDRILVALLYRLNLNNFAIWLASLLALNLRRSLKKRKAKETIIMNVTVGGPTSMNDVLVSIAKDLDLKVITIVENWDNISSKAVFNKHPDKVAVWGEQSRNFASSIHSIEPSRIELFGNLRVEWLIKNVVVKSLKSKVSFAGGSVNFEDELRYLKATEKILSHLCPELDLIYLPHPKYYAQCHQALVFLDDLGIEVLNREQVERAHSKFDFALPDMSTYLEFYEGALLVISPLSTMSLEAAILGIPSLGLDFSYPFPQQKLKYISECHDHLKDLVDKNILKTVNCLKDYKTCLTLALRSDSINQYLVAQSSISYLYFKEKRLSDIVSSLGDE